MPKIIKTEDFINKVKLIHDGKYDYSLVSYVNNTSKVKIICPIHGLFEQTPQNHLVSHGCIKCGVIETTLKIGLTTKSFIDKAILIHGDKYDYSLVNYEKNSLKIKIICDKHGVFEQRANNHLCGRGCNICGEIACGEKQVKTRETFINKAKTIHNNKYSYVGVNYKNSRTKIQIICPNHGEFYQKPYNHLSGHGCPICSASKGENKVSNFLIDNHIKFIQEKWFSDCKDIKPLPFDFYLPELNVCIEYQGIQHYKPIECWGGIKRFKTQQKRDKIKKEYCLNNNIHLIIIKYNNKKIVDFIAQKLTQLNCHTH